MTSCTRCHQPWPAAGLYHLGDEHVCPPCMAKQHEREQADPARFKPGAVTAPPTDHGLRVVSIERGMAARGRRRG